MSFPSQNQSPKKVKKFAYLYMMGAFSFFVIVIFVVYYAAYTFEPTEHNSERVGWVETEPKEIDVADIESLRKLRLGELIFHVNDFSSNRFYAESIILYEIALEKNPTNLDTLNGIGYSLSRTNSLDDVILHYAKAPKIEPRNVNAHNGMGVVYFDLKQYDEAISYFEKSLGLNENNVNALNGKAIALMKLGEYNESMILLDQVLESDPSNKNARNIQKLIQEQQN